MRQVPVFTSYLVIGDGRLARHLHRYLELQSLPFKTWNRKEPEAKLRESSSQASHVLLAISDSAIESFVTEHSYLLEKTCVHFSGALVSEQIPSAHPLMTFTEKPYEELAKYREIPFVLERGRNSLDELLPGFENPSFAIDREEKPLYHALCVLSGNFTVLLWEKAFRDFKDQLGLPGNILIPYLRQIAENLANAPEGESVLTGPLRRKDHVTIERNLQALKGDAYAEVYRAFVTAGVAK